MLLNGTVEIEKTALLSPQFALLHSVTCIQLRLITVLGNCRCVAVVSFLGVPSPLEVISRKKSYIYISEGSTFIVSVFKTV
jgi:hypothetical protein